MIWIFGGMIFYSISENMSWATAFFTSVSVGYGVFWVDLTYSSPSLAYTLFHLLVGCVAIAIVMAVFASSLTDNKEGWYVFHTSNHPTPHHFMFNT
jgi:hypothetical protein